MNNITYPIAQKIAASLTDDELAEYKNAIDKYMFITEIVTRHGYVDNVSNVIKVKDEVIGTINNKRPYSNEWK